MSYLLFQFFMWVFRVYSVYNIILCLKYCYHKILLPVLWTPLNYSEHGQWAIVTGCTDGIGKGFTFELARLKMDLVLISRSATKLEDLSKELREKYKIKTKIIVANFVNNNEAIPKIKSEIEDLDIALLVNNVGVSCGVKDFLDTSKTEVNELIEVNVKTTVNMCSIVMENMIKRKKGVIINTASLLSSITSPGVSVYGASKAFILQFSKDLHSEYRRFGITVHCLNTGPVRTNMMQVNINDWFIPTPERYARSALKTVGIEKVTTGFPSHDIIDSAAKLITDISPRLISWLFKIITMLFSNFILSTAGKNMT